MNNKIEISRELAKNLLHCGATSSFITPSMTGELRAILAAPVVERQPIGWFTDDYLTDKSSTTYDEHTSNRWKDKGWTVQPLYTSPPAPVSAVPVEVAELLNDMLKDDDMPTHWFAQRIDACLDKIEERDQ